MAIKTSHLFKVLRLLKKKKLILCNLLTTLKTILKINIFQKDKNKKKLKIKNMYYI